MGTKPDILMIDSAVQAVDVERRQALSQQYHLIYYDCDSTAQFIERLKPGGPYSKVMAIVRNGWHKIGKMANQFPFNSKVVPHFPPTLRIICCSGHGYDAADIKEITARRIWYCNTPNACTEAVANTGLSLVLDTFRFLTYAQWCARYDWMASKQLGMEAVDPCGQSLGIVGLGDIGLAIAQKCEAALGMNIHYQGPRRKETSERTLMRPAVYHSSVEDMIPEVDCIVLAAPYTEDTHHLLSTKQFSLAKKGGLRVVNIARGKMIDESALLEALESKKVVGVGLDVHEDEPRVNPKLRENWRVTLLPHIGVCSGTSWHNFEKTNLDNLEAFLKTGTPLTPINSV
ncbi:D-isomer specific 2-hydroxyacid dehydrogenase [Exophiala viscosa]|uniref:D-isomer specific 2-hydroxyacid dehydrogenase n=1 Tax=Exophiala viscosa TaxID=2486360 RepID=A0AAN6DS42_9EURO|nr:D-isomer specific 2-hydroxyacid dehydrogenase [Exophiala viscosa]